MARAVLVLVALLALACAPATSRAPISNAPAARARTRVFTAEVVARIPHSPRAFTQGLELHDGLLYEGTGLSGRSEVRILELESGRELRSIALASEHYGEGLTVLGGRVYQLTLRSERCFVYDARTLERVAEHAYRGEGWGLAHDERSLIMSDGSDVLRFLDPTSFAEQRRVRVRDGLTPVTRLNELEAVGDEIWANVWRTDRIARIDPVTGRVLAWVDLAPLREEVALTEPEAVLNGIAYDEASGRLFVTGKLWPTLFEIRLGPQSGG